MSEQQFDRFVEQVEEALDQVVTTGSDQQLFVASYLNGHFALQVARALNEKNYCLTQLDLAMQESLSLAFRNRELEGEDQRQVEKLWQSLLRENCQSGVRSSA